VAVWVIVVAAGSGTRFGGAKQFARLGDATILDRAVSTAYEHADGVVVALAPDAQWDPPPGVVATIGGATRSESVRSGLALVPDDAEVVVVHDAARPLAPPALFDAVIRAVLDGADAAIPVLPIVDTIKRVEGGRVLETLPRDGLVAVQTPQAFRATVLRAAHAAGGTGTDDAALVEAAGGTVVCVPGDPRNLKVTVAADMDVVRALLDAGGGE
jgi:2-C-methyl-D-erythritol 4-phosphate cytidylyltransferase